MAITVTNKNIPLIHRKEPQFMTPVPVNTVAGSFIITDIKEDDNVVMYVQSATVQYLYHNDEDGWSQVV